MKWFRKREPVAENVTPCWHMEGLLHQAADGKLRGLAKWYAWSHAKRCGRCLAFLRLIEATTLALRVAKAASSDEEGLSRLRAEVERLADKSPDGEVSS